ncbi:hypothetical protein [Chryseobacterium proteolyticum]|uniref:hypothetical protein n=1 Tax=Chryseobacterium proteolyticum TaxID=118127 RepID=UPI00398327FD
MKKILYSFLLVSSVCLFGQKNPSAKFAVANDIVGTVDMFKDKSDFIQSMHVYKTPATLPQNLKKIQLSGRQWDYRVQNQKRI